MDKYLFMSLICYSDFNSARRADAQQKNDVKVPLDKIMAIANSASRRWHWVCCMPKNRIPTLKPPVHL